MSAKYQRVLPKALNVNLKNGCWLPGWEFWKAQEETGLHKGTGWGRARPTQALEHGPELWKETSWGPFVFPPRLHNSSQGGVDEPLVCEIRDQETFCRQQMCYIFQCLEKHHLNAVNWHFPTQIMLCTNWAKLSIILYSHGCHYIHFLSTEERIEIS